jgi:hypothetical protein
MAGYRVHGFQKHEREIRRAERRQQKAKRLAERRAAKCEGVPIDTLPEPMQALPVRSRERFPMFRAFLR